MLADGGDAETKRLSASPTALSRAKSNRATDASSRKTREGGGGVEMEGDPSEWTRATGDEPLDSSSGLLVELQSVGFGWSRWERVERKDVGNAATRRRAALSAKGYDSWRRPVDMRGQAIENVAECGGAGWSLR